MLLLAMLRGNRRVAWLLLNCRNGSEPPGKGEVSTLTFLSCLYGSEQAVVSLWQQTAISKLPVRQ